VERLTEPNPAVDACVHRPSVLAAWLRLTGTCKREPARWSRLRRATSEKRRSRLLHRARSAPSASPRGWDDMHSDRLPEWDSNPRPGDKQSAAVPARGHRRPSGGWPRSSLPHTRQPTGAASLARRSPRPAQDTPAPCRRGAGRRRAAEREASTKRPAMLAVLAMPSIPTRLGARSVARRRRVRRVRWARPGAQPRAAAPGRHEGGRHERARDAERRRVSRARSEHADADTA
jgi:hypothetical protein